MFWTPTETFFGGAIMLERVAYRVGQPPGGWPNSPELVMLGVSHYLGRCPDSDTSDSLGMSVINSRVKLRD